MLKLLFSLKVCLLAAILRIYKFKSLSANNFSFQQKSKRTLQQKFLIMIINGCYRFTTVRSA